MAAVKRKTFKVKKSARPVVWLTREASSSRPKGAIVTIADLDSLWQDLELGRYGGVMVDRRFSFLECDAWEAALRIRERYPLLPVSVMVPVDFAPPQRGRRLTYVGQEL